MKLHLAYVLPALAIGGVVLLSGTAANASTVTFDSTLSLNSVSKVSFSSTGLNTTLTVGTPDTITDFITVSVGSGTWSASDAALTATFTFTVPTPDGTTEDSGTITGGQVNGSSADGTLTITWPSQPVEFDFTDGTALDVTLGGLSESCGSNNCTAGTYYMSGTFDVLNGPTATPLPAALPMFASSFGAIGLFGWWRKRKNAASTAAV
jgi:hypothetical protein